MTSIAAGTSECLPLIPDDALLARLDAILAELAALSAEAKRCAVAYPPLADTLSLEERIRAICRRLQPTVDACRDLRPTVRVDRDPATGIVEMSLVLRVGETPPDSEATR